MHKYKLLYTLLVLLCLASAVHAQLPPQLVVYNGFVAPAGFPFGPATIAVCSSGGSGGPPCSPLVVIYTDASGTRQKPNPFTIDPEGNGNFNFFAVCGTTYALQSFGNGYTTVLSTITTSPCSGGGGSSSGPASGDLSGNYPNPNVIKVNNGALPTSKTIVGTNGTGQIVDATGATLTNPLSVVHNPASITITGATPSVSGGNAFVTGNGSATTITNFTGGIDSQTIQVNCGDANTIIANNANIATFPGANVTCALNQAYEFTFYSSISKWVQVAGGTLPGGTPIQTQVNNAGVFGGTPCETFDTFGSGPQRMLCDNVLKGPNPVGSDIRAYGAVSYNPFITPANGGVTANCNGTTTVTISTATTFVNGVGVVIQGCGATNTMSTPGAPTVTTNLARVGEGTGDVTASGLTGPATYNYKIVAQDLGMGTTAASVTGSVTTGPSTLGPVTATISSCALSPTSATVTCSTTAAHGLVVGAQIHIINAGLNFNRFYNVATVPDNTHFTYISQQNGINGGSVPSDAGATVTWLNCNHIAWSAVTNAYRYFIYSDRGSPGTFNLIGVSKPSYPGSLFTDGSLYFDDFGAGHTTYTSGATSLVTWTAPATAPASAVNDALVTTIVSGAGTTTLVLANAASQTLSTTPMRVDNAPNIKAAACNNTGSIFLPNAFSLGANWVTNSILDLSSCPVAINVYNQQQNFNDTVIMGNATTITGMPVPGSGSTSSFGSGTYPNLSLGGAPGLQFFGNWAGIRRVSYQLGGNGLSGILVDGFAATAGFRYDDISGANVSGVDDTDIMLHSRGDTSGNAGQIISDGSINFNASQSNVSFAPVVYFADTANIRFHDVVYSGRGAMFQADHAGSAVRIERHYCQGCVTSLLFVASQKNAGSNQNFRLIVDVLSEDTSPEQHVSYLQSAGTLSLFAEGHSMYQYSWSGFPAQYSSTNGLPVQNTSSEGVFSAINGTPGGLDGTINTAQAGAYATKLYNAAISAGPAYPIFILSTALAAPGLALAAGGAVPLGNHTYSVSPIWANNGDGPVSSGTTINVTTGNQTVNVTWTALGAGSGCVGYRIIRDTQLAHGGGFVSGCATNTFSDASAFTDGQGPAIPSGGPTMLMPGTQGMASTKITLANCAITGQVLTAQNASPLACAPPGIQDGNGGLPVTTTPYTIQCDSATTLIDRAHLLRFQTGAAAVTVPLSSAAGCLGGFPTTLVDESAGALTVSRTGGDTFSVYDGGTVNTGATSFILTSGQSATLNQGAAGIWEIRISRKGLGGIINFLDYGAVDDDSTDNCANGAVAAFNTAINTTSSPGLIQAIIPKAANGKAFKLATNAASCAVQLTNSTNGITLYLMGNLDCAQTAASCIQLGQAGQVTIVPGEQYFIQGGGTLWSGVNLTKAGIYIEPGVNLFDIGGIKFGGPAGGTTNSGFGANSNVSGTCTNWSLFVDTPNAGGFVHDVTDGVTSNTNVSGGCGMGNPLGGSTGSNTVVFSNNTVATIGFAGGAGACGLIGIQDGGSYGTVENNNIYGFGIPVDILGIGHFDVGNQIDAAQCNSNGIGAAFQIGTNGAGGTVGPISLIGNKTQISTAHTQNLLNIAGGSTATLAGATITGNMNTLPTLSTGNIIPSTMVCSPPTGLNNTYCQITGNQNFGLPSPSGATQSGWVSTVGQVASASGSGLTANLGSTSAIVSSLGTRNFVVSCQVIITTQATTSSTLPVCNVTYTDVVSGVSVTRQVTPTLGASATGGCSGTAVTNPAVGTSCAANIIITPTNATAINLTTTGYASSGATAMQYTVGMQLFTW